MAAQWKRPKRKPPKRDPDLRDQVANAITRLPERQKLVVALYAYENLDFDEIGEVLRSDEQNAEELWGEAVASVAASVEAIRPEEFPAQTILGPSGEPLAKESNERTQLEISITEINDEVIAAISDDPDLVYGLSPRRFEELVAELYHRRGFKVQLTAPSNDKGVDIYVARHDELGSSLSVVQCKRYAPHRKIGVDLVRELKGTVDMEGASGGAIVTTSFFTRGARSLQEKHQFTLALHDFYQLQTLLNLQSSSMGR